MAGTSSHSEKEDYSLFLKLSACLIYAFSSSGLTFINKSLYVKFGFKSPLDVYILIINTDIQLLVSQCFCNVFICTLLMLYKEFNPNSFKFFEKIGMRIPSLSEALGKLKIGFIMGLTNLVAVLFGLYSVKNVNIPL